MKYNSDQIAKQNDAFRSTMISTSRHKVVFTKSVGELDPLVLDVLLKKVRGFATDDYPETKFSYDNDPHQEHDFGKVRLGLIDYFWKIDYYDTNWEYGVDPYEESPNRLLTIISADEY